MVFQLKKDIGVEGATEMLRTTKLRFSDIRSDGLISSQDVLCSDRRFVHRFRFLKARLIVLRSRLRIETLGKLVMHPSILSNAIESEKGVRF